MEQLDLNATNIVTFGNGLAEHAKAISDASFGIVDVMDNTSIYNIKDELKNINQRKKSSFVFSKNYTVEEIIQNNKRILSNLEKSLCEQQTIMVQQVEQFNYAKKLIASFVNRLNNYISEIKKALAELNNVDNDNLSMFEQSNNETLKIILEQQLHDYEKAKRTHTLQYQNIDLLFRNYAISLSKMVTYRNTTLPSVYTAVAISNGILAQQESLDSIKEIDTLLDDIVSYNNNYLNNKKQIEDLDESVDSMLQNEGLINSDSVSDKEKVLSKKYNQ